MLRLYVKGIGMMAGLIIGAGVFVLPYAFAKAGVFWGSVHLIVALLVVYFLHQWYGEVSFYTKGNHRFVGYVGMYLGKRAKFFATITTLGAYYGSLLVYGIMGGIFLVNFTSLFNGHTVYFLTLIFFAAGGLMALFGVSRIAEINFYLTLPIFGFIIYLLIYAFPHIKVENFFSSGNLLMNKNWFLPYGVWLFSLTGFSAIPPTRDIFADSPVGKFKKVISISLFLAAVSYVVFILAVLGVSGPLTTQDAFSGIRTILGDGVMAIGSIIGLLCIFTSYIASAMDTKNMFRYDYKIPHFSAWLAATVPPVVAYIIMTAKNIDGIVSLLGIIGSFGMGLLGVFIILMRHKIIGVLKAGDKDDLVAEIDRKDIKVKRSLEIIILIGIVSAVIYDLKGLIFGIL